SYHAPTGHYNRDSYYFLNSGHDNPPLHALKDGVDGGDGVYSYSSGFPNQTYQSEGYYADVLFAPGPDTTPPTVSSVNPTAGATGVATSTAVTATFSEALDPTTVNGTTFTLQGPSGPVTATVTYNSNSNTATLQPSSVLAASTTY